jgi:hypothetical protein
LQSLFSLEVRKGEMPGEFTVFIVLAKPFSLLEEKEGHL